MPNYFLDYIKTIFIINFFHTKDDEPDPNFKAAARKISGPYSLDYWDHSKFATFTSKTAFKITNKRLKKGYVRLKHIMGWSRIELRHIELADGKMQCKMSFFTNRSSVPFFEKTINNSIDYLLEYPSSRMCGRCDFEIETYRMSSREITLGSYNRLWFIGSIYNGMRDSLAKVYIMFAKCMSTHDGSLSDNQRLVAKRVPGCYVTHYDEANRKIVVNVMDQGIFFRKLRTGDKVQYTLFIDGVRYGHFLTSTGDVREWEQLDAVTLSECPFGQVTLCFKTDTWKDVPLFQLLVLDHTELAKQLDGDYYSFDGRLALFNPDKNVQAVWNEADVMNSENPECSINFRCNMKEFKIYLPCKNGYKSLSTLSLNDMIPDDKRNFVLHTDSGFGATVFIYPVVAVWGAPFVKNLKVLEQSKITDNTGAKRTFEVALKLMWKRICSTLIHGNDWHKKIKVLRERDVESIARHFCGMDPSRFLLDLISVPEYNARFERWTAEFIVWEMMNCPWKWKYYASVFCSRVTFCDSSDDEYESSSSEELGPPEVVSDCNPEDAVKCDFSDDDGGDDDNDDPPAAGAGSKRRPGDHPLGRWRLRYRYGNPRS